MKPTIIIAGRKMIEDFWISGILNRKLTHTPFIMFVSIDNQVEVVIVNKAEDFNTTYKDISDNTKIMIQWSGSYKSDFFQTTVGEIRIKIKGEEKIPVTVSKEESREEKIRRINNELIKHINITAKHINKAISDLPMSFKLELMSINKIGDKFDSDKKLRDAIRDAQGILRDKETEQTAIKEYGDKVIYAIKHW